MKRASEVLSKLLDENSRGKAQGYSSVFGGWRDLAGLSLSEHSKVYEIQHNNLFVEVDHNGWMQILLLRKARILNKLRSRYPELEIRDLKVRINPAMTPPAAAGVGPAGGAEPAGAAGAAGAGSPGEGGRDTPGAASAGTSGSPVAPSAGTTGASGGSDNAAEVERIVSEVSQESLKRHLRSLFLSSLKGKRGTS